MTDNSRLDIKDLNLDIEDFNAIAAPRTAVIGGATPSGKPTRIVPLYNFNRDFGSIVSKFYRKIAQIDTTTCVPYFIFSLSLIENDGAGESKTDMIQLEFEGAAYEKEGVSIESTNERFLAAKVDPASREYGLIGYDIEFQDDELLSHQFCFDIKGNRLGIVISTKDRFTDETFISLIRMIVYKISKYTIENYYIFSHFSVTEGSWIDNSKKSLIGRKDKKWTGNIKLNTEKIKKKTYSVFLHFCETKDLFMGSLKDAAESCGFAKMDIPAGTIEKMAEYKRDHFDDFCRYGIRDAIVTCAIPLDTHSRFAILNVNFSTRISKYSESYFQQFYEKHYAEYGDWRELLGQVYGWPVKGFNSGKAKFQSWMPNLMQRSILEDWYHGGRNEVKRVGCFDKAYYHDLKSAYPTAVIMMRRDYDFSRWHHHWGNNANDAIKYLRKDGPFQPFGVKVFAEFKDGAVPIFPANFDGAIVFPRIFSGVVTWPEYWTALELDLLKSHIVIELWTFKAFPERKLPEDMKRLLGLRREDPLLYKNLLNYNYGKTAQGVSGDTPYSSISCPALAAYMTGCCRAAVGELANLNTDYYAITTDGFISPRATVESGPFNSQVQEVLAPMKYDWIELEAKGDKSFFIKTRGYALWNDPAKPAVEGCKLKRNKKARMGIQASDIKSFISQINAGHGLKKSFRGFSSLKAGQITKQFEKDMLIDTTYDMKHVPIGSSITETVFEADGEKLELLSFDTRPLNDIYEYQSLRGLAHTANNKKLAVCNKRGLDEKAVSALLLAHAFREPSTRHVLWEFRKRLAQSVNVDETDWTEKQHEKFSSLKPRPIPAEFGKIPEFDWIYEMELKIVKDPSRRSVLKENILQNMEDCTVHLLTPPKTASSRPQPTPATQLAVVSVVPTVIARNTTLKPITKPTAIVSKPIGPNLLTPPKRPAKQ